ncbi:hypothetical protein M9H77_02856 [Catharanthus roseus]|uniref:Uncharacterized protein n=1 Tax=Catharanthus roseus TaxID=4058 RepID=A0ACC0CA29_CATRO|nr:hypothetical protein M9H77_02856 [Catharanthus roseus]
MSLVDYASSSDEEEAEPKSQELQPQQRNAVTVEEAETLDSSRLQNSNSNQRFSSTVNRKGDGISQQAEPPAFKLPDASLLLSSSAVPSHLAHASDHSSRVAAAMSESESRKRDLNGTSSSSHPRSKVPRGNLRHTKSIPDTGGGNLIPPQLTGRSNIVTEDLSKLFTMHTLYETNVVIMSKYQLRGFQRKQAGSLTDPCTSKMRLPTEIFFLAGKLQI